MGDVLASRLRRQSLQAEFTAATSHALAGGKAPGDPRSAGGDERRLRGIPVIGSCPGAIPGTRPDSAAMRLRGLG